MRKALLIFLRIVLFIASLLALLAVYLYIMESRIDSNRALVEKVPQGDYIKMHYADYFSLTVWDDDQIEFIGLSHRSKNIGVSREKLASGSFVSLRALIDDSRFFILPSCLGPRKQNIRNVGLSINYSGKQFQSSSVCNHDLKVSKSILNEFDGLVLSLSERINTTRYSGTGVSCSHPDTKEVSQVQGWLEILEYRLRTGDWFLLNCEA